MPMVIRETVMPNFFIVRISPLVRANLPLVVCIVCSRSFILQSNMWRAGFVSTRAEYLLKNTILKQSREEKEFSRNLKI